MQQPEPWLRGPLDGIPAALMPIAHSLIQIREDLPLAVKGISEEQLWTMPGGAASAGFHIKHLAGSLDRLYTYARGEKLLESQFDALRLEKEIDGRTMDELLAAAIGQIEKALQQLHEVKPHELHDTRLVGRAQLPSNQLALLYHGVEHAQRHLGAVIATAKILRADVRPELL